MRVLVLAALAFGGAAQAQQAPAPAPAPSGPSSMGSLDGNAAERFMDRQSDYRRLDGDVSGSGRSSRAVPVSAKDVVQGLEVRDSKGLVVGTVAGVNAGVATVAGPLGKVEVDVASIAKNRKGLLINLPKAKIDAMMR
jgi:hypothetical protein